MRNAPLNTAPVLALVLAAACWGIVTVITKHVLANIPPLTLLVVQLAISVSFLWILVFVQRLRLPQRRDIVRLGSIGILNPGLAYTLGLLGLTRTTASMSSLLWAAEPILILVLAWLILRERLTRTLLAFSLLSLRNEKKLGLGKQPVRIPTIVRPFGGSYVYACEVRNQLCEEENNGHI
jgi:drug/metabolite transporter (DMT)-like permease